MAKVAINSETVTWALRNCQDFECHGALRGITEPGEFFPNRLPYAYAGLFNRTKDQIVYVVLSYETPIAWVLVGGEVVIPDVTYSVTTSRHQNRVRAVLLPDTVGKPYSVTWEHEGFTYDARFDTEAERDAKIVEVVKSGYQNVRIEDPASL